jgi:hypothetical protein
MPKRTLPGPERAHLLGLYIKCLKRAEWRIIRSKKFTLQVARNVEAYTLAVQALRIKRSEFAAELEGMPWEAKPFKPRLLAKPQS